MFGLLKRRRRAALRSRPLLAAWRRILEERVPFYSRLSESDRRELEEHIQVFLAEKSFEGCAGFQITDATECFFERPRQLRQSHPKLYEELKRFYLQDPVAFASPPTRDRSTQGAGP